MGSLIKKRRKRMRTKTHKQLLKKTRWARRQQGKEPQQGKESQHLGPSGPGGQETIRTQASIVCPTTI